MEKQYLDDPNPSSQAIQQQKEFLALKIGKRHQRNPKTQQNFDRKNLEFNPDQHQQRNYEKRYRGPRNQYRSFKQNEKERQNQSVCLIAPRKNQTFEQGSNIHKMPGLQNEYQINPRNETQRKAEIDFAENKLKAVEEEGLREVKRSNRNRHSQKEQQFSQHQGQSRQRGRGKGRGRRGTGRNEFQGRVNNISEGKEQEQSQNKKGQSYLKKSSKRNHPHERKGRGNNLNQAPPQQNYPHQRPPNPVHQFSHQALLPIKDQNQQLSQLQLNLQNLQIKGQSGELKEPKNQQKYNGRQKMSKQDYQAKQKQRSQIQEKRKIERQERNRLNQEKKQQLRLQRDQKRIQREQKLLQKEKTLILNHDHPNSHPNSQSLKQPKNNRQRKLQRQSREESHKGRRGNLYNKNGQHRRQDKQVNADQGKFRPQQQKQKEQKKVYSKLQDRQIFSKEQENEREEDQIPQFLLCPISQVLMVDPVLVTVCGHTFQSSVIRQWVKKKPSCPLCSKNINDPQKMLMKNFALSDAILHFMR